VSNRFLERTQQAPGSSSTNPDIVRGFELARSVYLASQALPAAGAFVIPSQFTVPAGITEISFWVTYTRGAVGGFPYLQVLFGNGTEEGNDISIDQTVVVAQPLGTQNIYEQQLAGPIPATGAAITYVIAVKVPRGATTIRMIAAEGGVTATPGTIAVALTGGT
jgi:hypothetical protein